MRGSKRFSGLIVGLAAMVVFSFVGAGAALAAAAPTVSTGPSSNVRYTTASVYGDVDPNGSSTHWYVEYGTSAALGLRTGSVPAGAGVANLPVSAALTGLVPGTHYLYRFVAVNALGAIPGAEAAFSTPASAPSVTTGAVSAIGDGEARFNAVVDPHGLATVVSFQYGVTTAYGTSTASRSAGDATVPLALAIATGRLAMDTTYHVRAQATNAAGTAVGADTTFTTLGPPIVSTGTPTGVGAGQATLNGTVDPGGHPTAWYFQFGLTTSYGADTAAHSLGASLASIAVSAPISGLAPGTPYHARLVAHNGLGTVVGPDVTFGTLGPTLSLSAPNVVFGRSVTLAGTVPTGAANDTVTIFEQRLGSPSFVVGATVLTATAGSWSFVAAPRVETTFKVLWDGATSSTQAVRVRPSVTLRVTPGGQIVTHVRAARALAGRLVLLQRLEGRQWQAISAARLDASSSAVFAPALPKATVQLRVMITRFQAGSGYLAGFSRERLLTRH